MPLPAYGILGHAFLLSRTVQLLVLLTTIGLLSQFISSLTTSSIDATGTLISYLCLACLGTVYSAFTIILYIDSALPFHYASICDALFYVAYIIISVLVGEPIARVTCRGTNIPDSTTGGEERQVLASIGKDGLAASPRLVRYRRNALMTPEDIEQHRYESWLHKTEIRSWIGENKQECEIFKASWAMALIGVVLFLVSTAACVGLWWKLKKQAKEEKMRDSKLDMY